jgi:hypothetical protein
MAPWRDSSSACGGEPRRFGAVAAWRTAWRLGGVEEAEKVVEKAGGGGAACPSWQPHCIGSTHGTDLGLL